MKNPIQFLSGDRMNPLFYVRNAQNKINYLLRSHLSWRRPINGFTGPLSKHDEKLQAELSEFLRLFDWTCLQKYKKHGRVLRAADIGARDFSFAPVFDSHFRSFNLDCEIHGVEIDAFRRYSNLRCRADYGEYYASQIPRGEFHATDFLKWCRSLHVGFLLHPFVTPEPPLRWGLPLSTFKPQELFDHAFELLRSECGVLILSNPSEREYEISLQLAENSGFKVAQEKVWRPTLETLHQRPRFGAFLRSCP